MLSINRNNGQWIKNILVMVITVFCTITGRVNLGFADEQTTKDAPAPKVISLDTNHDGNPDQWQYYENGQIVRTEADTNFDGKVDEIGHFVNGKLTRVEKDSDYDGKMDRWVEY
jgi:hypothetical protein